MFTIGAGDRRTDLRTPNQVGEMMNTLTDHWLRNGIFDRASAMIRSPPHFRSEQPVTIRRFIFIAAAATAFVGCGSDASSSSESVAAAYDATDTAPQVFLDAESNTILGQPIVYPDGTAQISSSIITLAPGEETGWHYHEAPLYAYILSGSLTVDYGDDGERTYEAGDAILEAIGTSHNGRTSSDEPVRILVVNMGSDTVANTLAD